MKQTKAPKPVVVTKVTANPAAAKRVMVVAAPRSASSTTRTKSCGCGGSGLK
ncbi:hypothetical protein SAMN05444172_2585 [Burkholderia sp. GAS332]|nr:hypothetical protein SAMN05444172_2585 [Burkholderia sp. GAS332]